SSKRNPESPCMSWETDCPELTDLLKTQILVVKTWWQYAEPLYSWVGRHLPENLVDNRGRNGGWQVLRCCSTGQPLRSTRRHKVVRQSRCPFCQFTVDAFLSPSW